MSDILSSCVSFVIAIIFFYFFSWDERRECRKECQEEFTRLLLSEFKYWNRSTDESDPQGTDSIKQAIGIGATGAISNVLAAINGHPAEWHKAEEKAGANEK